MTVRVRPAALMSDTLSETSIIRNIQAKERSYVTSLKEKDLQDTANLLGDFIPGRTWELSEVLFESDDESVTLEAIANRHASEKYVPVAVQDSSRKTPIESAEPRYLVQDKPFAIGSVGMIFKAYDRKLGKLVAIKTIQQGYYSTDDKQRHILEREAKVMANVVSPHIVRVHAFTEIPSIPRTSDKDVPAIIMDYMDPESNLGTIVKKGTLSPSDVALCMQQLGETVDSMAKQGLYHRDLKPTNIFWNTTDKYVTIADFGLANTTDFREEMSGSLPYMSPEHWDNIQKVDTQSEVFVLATIAYELLTGKRRFIAEDSDFDYMHGIEFTNGFTEPKCIKQLRDSLASSHIDVDRIIHVFDKAQKNKKLDRYNSATMFANELAEALRPQQ